MSLLRLVILTAILAFSAGPATPQSIGVFDGQTDVGKARPGSATYEAATGTYHVSGSGQNMWADHDDFHFVWKKLEGDFILTARVHFLGTGVEEHRKLGWSIRPSLETGSTHVSAEVHGNGLTSLQWRRAPGDITHQDSSKVTSPDIIQLERRGNRYIMSAARMGDTLVSNEVADIPLGDAVYVGIFVCAHNDTVTENAAFDKVRITRPAAENFVPYRDYIGGNLEVMDVATASRNIVYSSPDAIQAPNWTRDGKALIYNAKGRLYRFDLATGKPEEIPTGFATDNNNDHVLSFDGKMLGISHHSAEDQRASIVYTLPAKGGTPKRITAKGPSYLHSWSPDGKYLVFTGGRSDLYNIYRIPAAGGEEVRLTDSKPLDDGPEYSPDGKWIYFNSARTGLMQLWRMKPDGSGQEQRTNDRYNNWFPHFSPDGQSIVFISYMDDIKATDHPWYKHVYIRIMPAAGGPAKVLAYLYGGQGTINVPSWSPDGKRIAFVSNTR